MITDKKILIIGSGISGIASAELLMEAGADPVLYDSNPALEEAEIRSRLPKNSRIRILTGELPEKEKKETEVVILSPGVPIDLPLVEELRKNGAIIWGEVELDRKSVV